MSRRPFRPRLDCLEPREVPATIVVNTAGDPLVTPGTPFPVFAADGGLTSLREAVESINAGQNRGDVLADVAEPYGVNDTILFAAGVNAPVAPVGGILNGDYDLLRTVRIDGAGAAGGSVTVSGSKAGDRLFDSAAGATVTLQNLVITAGRSGGDGGGMRAAGPLVARLVTFQGNTAVEGSGGGLFAQDAVTLGAVTFATNAADGDGGGLAFDDSATGGGLTVLPEATPTLFDRNTAGQDGGGLFLAGRGLTQTSATVTALALDGNTAGRLGGGLAAGTRQAFGGTVQLDFVRVENNTAATGGGGAALFDTNGAMRSALVAGNTVPATGTGGGGGLYVAQFRTPTFGLTVTNTTVADNRGDPGGGGILALRDFNLPTTAGPFLLLRNVTVTNNQASAQASGLASSGSGPPVATANSIFAGNTAPPGGTDVAGPLRTDGFNVYGSYTGGLGFGATDIQTNDARLDELADNGGPTRTVRLLAGSPALGAADPSQAPATDQRNRPRPVPGGPVDVGAFQAQRPTGSPDGYTAPFGQVLSVAAPGVLGNDQNNDVAGPLTAVLVSGPPASAGTLTLNPDGSFVFTPAPGFSGTTAFFYRTSDGVTTSLTASTVTLFVLPPVPPTAAPDSYTTPFRQPLSVPAPGVLGNDAAGSGPGPLTAELLTAPPATAGTLAFNRDGSFLFTPAGGFTGPTSFTYAASDGASTGPSTTVALLVQPAVPPTAVPDLFATPFGQTLTVPAPGVLANDALGTGPVVVTFGAVSPAAGTLLPAGTGGGFTFAPAAGFAGTATVPYTVRDQFTGLATSSVVAITVGTPPLPTAVADTFAVPAGGRTVPAPGLLANDTLPADAGPFQVQVLDPVPGLTVGADGGFTFVPPAGPDRTVSFRYVVVGAGGPSAATTVTLAVAGTPLAAPDRRFGPATTGQPFVVFAADGLLLGAASPAGGPVRVVDVVGPSGDELTVNPDGSFRLVPAADRLAGTLTFTVRLTDGQSTTAPATVTIDVVEGPLSNERFLAFGSGAGEPPRVRVVRPARPDLVLTPFEETFLGGVRVAVADLDRDGVDDVAVTPGAGGGPRVVVFSGADGRVLANFFAFEPSFRGGAHVAAADTVAVQNGRRVRTSMLAVGAGSFLQQPGAPRVRAFVDLEGLPLFGTVGTAPVDFFAYDPRFQGGVRVAVGDLAGDGTFRLVTVPGPSGGPVVRVWDPAVRTGTVPAVLQELQGLGATGSDHRGGAYVATTGGAVVVVPDGLDTFANTELAFRADTLADPSGAVVGGTVRADTVSRAPELAVFAPAGGGRLAATPTVVPLGDATFRGGLRVTAGAAVLVGYGPGGRGRVRQFPFDPATGLVDLAGELPLTAFDGDDFGVFVGAAPRPAD